MSGWNTGRLMRLELGHEPGTTKFWFRAEKANSRDERVRNGLADGIFPPNCLMLAIGIGFREMMDSRF